MINRLPKPFIIALAGGIVCCLMSIPAEIVELWRPRSLTGLIVNMIIWTSLLCFGMGAGVIYAQNLFLDKKGLSSQQIKNIAIGSLLAGAAAGGPGQFLYSFLCSIVPNEFFTELSRTVAWILVGGLMALVISKYIPNMKRNLAVLGGILGGFLGALTFIMMAYTVGFGFRQGGAFFIGLCIGFMIGVVEKVGRKAWLTVLYSPRRFSQVNIGSQAITAGSGLNDTVHIEGVPASAISFKMTNGKIEYTENGMTQFIQPGELKKLGKVMFIVCDPSHPFSLGPKFSSGDSNSAGVNKTAGSSNNTPSYRPSSSLHLLDSSSYGSSLTPSSPSRSNRFDISDRSVNSGVIDKSLSANNENNERNNNSEKSSDKNNGKIRLKLPPRR